MSKSSEQINQDPLGLRDLPLVDPPADGWAEIRQVLEADQATVRTGRFRHWGLAASVLLVAGLAFWQMSTPDLVNTQPIQTASVSTPEALVSDEEPLDELITLSQLLEKRLRQLRETPGALPAQSLIYISELEDMIAQVDGNLSANSDSVDLWGQRVNLLLDLESIYQHHWEREYGRMASL